MVHACMRMRHGHEHEMSISMKTRDDGDKLCGPPSPRLGA
jgi:hypothetical protein